MSDCWRRQLFINRNRRQIFRLFLCWLLWDGEFFKPPKSFVKISGQRLLQRFDNYLIF